MKLVENCGKCFSKSGICKGNPFLIAFYLKQRIVWLIGGIGQQFCKADMGHKGETPRSGIFITLTELFICMVFDHFNNIWAPRCAKNISALARCLRVS